MKCPRCDAEMDVKPFGKGGARSCRCTGDGCKTYFVLAASGEKTTLPPPKVPKPDPGPPPSMQPRARKTRPKPPELPLDPQPQTEPKKNVEGKSLYERARDGEL